MNNDERERWVLNDESLYRWWKSSRLSMREFLRQNKAELDEFIEKAVNKKPR